jgi:uncharacterized protein (DUF924 family)
MSSPEEVLSYWFPEEDIRTDRETFGRRMRWWFAGGPELDSEITERFGHVLEQARRGELDHWADTPRGRLALIIVLDQFSRHIHRGTTMAFAADSKAQQLTLAGLAAREDERLAFSQRHFFYMPLMHAEDEQLQQLSLDRFAALKAFAENLLQFAQGHSDEIARYSRFPLRNAALGRQSCAEELAFLETAQPR